MSATRVPRRLRERVRRRANGLCEYCHFPEQEFYAAFNCDHCIAEKAGGRTEARNLAWACPACNGHKGSARYAEDPDTRKQVALFNPRRQVWVAHFRWSEDLCRIIGLTPAARATVDRLRLNRPQALYNRGLLVKTGHHPGLGDSSRSP